MFGPAKTVTEPAKTVVDMWGGETVTLKGTIIPDGDYKVGMDFVGDDGIIVIHANPGCYICVYYGEVNFLIPVGAITHVNGHSV